MHIEKHYIYKVTGAFYLYTKIRITQTLKDGILEHTMKNAIESILHIHRRNSSVHIYIYEYIHDV